MSTVAEKDLKLNLGAMEQIPGWRGMNLDESLPGVDYVGDVSDLSRFKDNSVSKIMASHILEHFPHGKTISVLREWIRVLRPGGVLYVAVPDFQRTVEIYMALGLKDWIINFLWGDQGYETAFHYTGFDFKRLCKILHDAGFKDVSRVDNFKEAPEQHCSRIVSSYDKNPVSLNVMAIK